MTIVSIAIFLISAATLGLELVLVRILSIGHWHHFSYLVISTALLGFGAGGIFVTIGSKLFTKKLLTSLWVFALGFGLSVPIAFQISQRIPFDELQLIWDRRQIWHLLGYYLLFFLPFFCGGAFLALCFSAFGDKAHRLYFYNMVGSGIGAAGIVALMYGNAPPTLLLLISAVAFLAAMLSVAKSSRCLLLGTLILAVICLFVFSSMGPFPLEPQISEHKSLVYYTALPQAEVLARKYGPLARLDCVRAPAIRYFPGLSLAYQGQLPQQMLIISDADGLSPVNHFQDIQDLRCYDYTTSALPYHLLKEPNTCIIGAGGGSDVAQALALGAGRITAVEMNADTIELVRSDFDDFASGLYNRSDVQIVVAEGRSFLQTTDRLFDIINISLLDSFSASAAGLYALNESHLYTLEAVDKALSRLQPHGLLSITRVLKTPPRDSLKMLATVAQAMRERGISEPGRYIIMIRSLATATIVASPQPLSDAQTTDVREFARARSFDLVHLPDIKAQEVNEYHVLDEPVYFEAAQRILSPDHEAFYHDYVYDIRPATDDRPYFFDFFKWRSLPHIIRALPQEWLRFSEWGYLLLVVTLLQAVGTSALFILLPLIIARRVREAVSGKAPTFVYFLLLGLAFMFLEMGYIQKLTLLIGHPVFGVTVTLLGFLVFSGCGALVAERVLTRQVPTSTLESRVRASRIVWMAVLGILVLGIANITLVTLRFDWLVGFSRSGRILLGLTMCGPPAFFMGIPFPTGLRGLYMGRKALIPWAWGINGFASVTGAVLGTLLAISLGFTALVFLALGFYLAAAVTSKRIFQ